MSLGVLEALDFVTLALSSDVGTDVGSAMTKGNKQTAKATKNRRPRDTDREKIRLAV